jgi:hypothetical protein
MRCDVAVWVNEIDSLDYGSVWVYYVELLARLKKSI